MGEVPRARDIGGGLENNADDGIAAESRVFWRGNEVVMKSRLTVNGCKLECNVNHWLGNGLNVIYQIANLIQ